ncbi:MAG: response regulator, partial [Elusimicrobia bacterium]|nr:response regulator [Elusimicrobiota bacterium]
REPLAPALPAPERRGGGETVLVVEDDAALRAIMRRALSREGYRLLEASGPEAAASAARGHEGPLDLALVDVVLRGGDGMSAVGALRAARPGVRVLYMTGFVDRDDFRREVVDKRLPFIQKPFTPEQLVRKVRETLDGAPR